MAVSEFQRTLMNILSRHRVSVANLAERTGYNPLLLENLIAGEEPRYTRGLLYPSWGCP